MFSMLLLRSTASSWRGAHVPSRRHLRYSSCCGFIAVVQQRSSGSRARAASTTTTRTTNHKQQQQRSYHHPESKSGSGGSSGGSSSSSSSLGLFSRSMDAAATFTTAASYKVAKVTKSGDLHYVNMQTSEILKSAPSLYARDLFSLQLTSRQERSMQRAGSKKKTVPPSRRGPPAAILPRRDSIVVCFGNIQAVAAREFVLLFDAHHPLVQQFSRSLAHRFQQLQPSSLHREHQHPADAAFDQRQDATADNDPNQQQIQQQQQQQQQDTVILPMELVFLEEVLRDTCLTYSRRIRMLEPIVDNFLNKVSNEAFSDSGLHLLVPVKDSLQSLEIQIKQALDTIADLLHNDDDMVGLLLTEQWQARQDGTDVPLERHEEVELLLEEYARQLNSALSEINYLLQRVQSKQEFVALALSSYRNRMARMNVMIDIAGVSLGIGTLVAGFFGMNLISGLEQSPGVFYAVIVSTSVAGMLVATTSMSYLSGRAVQKRATERLEEIETLSNALSDMRALDYTLKSALDNDDNGGGDDANNKPMTKTEFRQEFRKAKYSRRVTDKEVDLLFDIFDIVKDGHIGNDDFTGGKQS